MAQNARSKSYWRTRRDILCNVETHLLSEMSDNESDEFDQTPSCTGEEVDIVTVNDVNDDDIAVDKVDFYFDSDCSAFHNRGSTSESDSELSDSDEVLNLAECLAEWVRQFDISRAAVTSLLHLLHRYHPSLPIDGRTLLHTPRSTAVKEMAGNASYRHIGIQANIEKLYAANPNDTCFTTGSLELQINVDGLPIFKSSSFQLWPILGLVKGSSDELPFTVGIYGGNQKPADVTEFLTDFVTELHQLESEGLNINNHHFTVKIHSIVCDAPARALLKNTKGHSGYHGCERCTQKGEYRRKVVFPQTDAPLRTNVAFDELVDPEHHHGPSPLKGLNIGFVSQFCLDYMHLVCLGIMRRLLMLWIRGPLSCRLSAGMVQQISERLFALKDYLPCEFARRPRSLYEVDRWKATEFRQFLLYSGPVVLKGVLNDALYRHFMLLSVGMYCCLHTDFCYQYADYCRQLFVIFVQHAATLYGNDILVYNVHSLIHTADDVTLFGSLDNISCFPFENHLRLLKKLVHRPSMPLQQILCRLSERNNRELKQRSKVPSLLDKMHENGPVPAFFDDMHSTQQFKQIRAGGFIIKASEKDGCVMLKNGHIGMVQNIVSCSSGVHIIYIRAVNQKPFYDYPLSSSFINIHAYSQVVDKCYTIPYQEIARKCVRFPQKGGQQFVVIPFAHRE